MQKKCVVQKLISGQRIGWHFILFLSFPFWVLSGLIPLKPGRRKRCILSPPSRDRGTNLRGWTRSRSQRSKNAHQINPAVKIKGSWPRRKKKTGKNKNKIDLRAIPLIKTTKSWGIFLRTMKSLFYFILFYFSKGRGDDWILNGVGGIGRFLDPRRPLGTFSGCAAVSGNESAPCLPPPGFPSAAPWPDQAPSAKEGKAVFQGRGSSLLSVCVL